MKISDQQREHLQSLRCIRLKNIDKKLLAGISGPIIDGAEKSSIVTLFSSDQNIEDDKDDIVASYVILSPNDDILAFFSIRCGELFSITNKKLVQLADDAWRAIEELAYNQSLSEDKKSSLLNKIKEAGNAGLSINEIEAYSDKKQFFTQKENIEPNKDINRVYKVFPGAELKLLGVNEKSKQFWKSLGMHRKMGETIFWAFVIDKLEDVKKYIGVQYLYLFAADAEADGNLVNYYKTRLLHIDDTMPQVLSTSKPLFDRDCRFLYQTLKELINQRQFFFDNFNEEESELA